ncbi:MAG: FAD-dependent oxidoreductase, partial [Acidobacteriaceae bacterium]|nr:FAD-dependent oxidoreductase [Acidobacteriaceae bacterium]
AYHLRRLGHFVSLYEAEPKLGGMMRWGIPEYRLPRDILDAEIQRILDSGIEAKVSYRVNDLKEAMEEAHFDAVFLAIGAHLAKRAYIPAGDATRILHALDLLRAMESGEAPQLGRRVVVCGGGNTALDAARTAKRLGAAEAIIVYRRTRDKMPAHESELREALAEGVKVKWLSTIKTAGGEKLVIERMMLDATGFPRSTGEFETIGADSVVLALGQDVDLSLLQKLQDIEIVEGVVQVNRQMMTGRDGVFAGGDMVPAERTVTTAVGHGKKAARCIDAYLRGDTFEPAPKRPIASFERLNTHYYCDAPATVQPELNRARRQSTFSEIYGGLDENSALFEARRCLSCGNCFECDNCYGVCPDNAVVKMPASAGNTFRINYDYCKGCGICAAECPCGAIEMIPERS